MPDSGRSFSCDAVDGPAYQSAFVKDLVPFIDRTFNVRAEKAGRCIGGLSMGGYGAIKLALQYPELFVCASDFTLVFSSTAITWPLLIALPAGSITLPTSEVLFAT